MPNHNQKISLKRTALEISRLGLGTAPLGGMFSSVSEQDSDDLIATALNLGINYIDTAPLYGHGRSEIRLGRALRAANSNYVLSTKVGRVLNETSSPDKEFFKDADPTKESVYDWSAEGIKRSLEESLERLGIDHVDILLMHDCEDYLEQAINVAYPVLDDYRSQGIIKAVGMGLNLCAPSIKVMQETDLDCALIAGRYTLLCNSIPAAPSSCDHSVDRIAQYRRAPGKCCRFQYRYPRLCVERIRSKWSNQTALTSLNS